MVRTLVWVSFNESTLPSSSGPNELTVARSCTPNPPVRLTNSTGTPFGFQSQPMSAERLFTRSVASPGIARPDKSPFMSATKTGTP